MGEEGKRGEKDFSDRGDSHGTRKSSEKEWEKSNLEIAWPFGEGHSGGVGKKIRETGGVESRWEPVIRRRKEQRNAHTRPISRGTIHAANEAKKMKHLRFGIKRGKASLFTKSEKK